MQRMSKNQEFMIKQIFILIIRVSRSRTIANISFFFDFQFNHYSLVYVRDRHNVNCQNVQKTSRFREYWLCFSVNYQDFKNDEMTELIWSYIWTYAENILIILFLTKMTSMWANHETDFEFSINVKNWQNIELSFRKKNIIECPNSPFHNIRKFLVMWQINAFCKNVFIGK